MTLYLWSCSRGIEGPNPSSSTSEFSANQVFCKSVAQFTRRGSFANYLAHTAITRSQTPLLHVFPDNPALALYSRLGFRERVRL